MLAQQLLLELFPSKLVFLPHSPPLNLTNFPDYVRNPDEVPSTQCYFLGIGVTCNDPIYCSHRCFQVVEFYRFLKMRKSLLFFSFSGKDGENRTSDLTVHNLTSCRRRRCEEVD